MVHRLVILGGGVGGTLLANVLVHKLHEDEIDVTVVDATGKHVYQPGWLYVPFGEEESKNLVKSERKLLHKRVNLVTATASLIEPELKRVVMDDGSALPYDSLVVATGARIVPEAVPGFEEAAHHFYSEQAARRLKGALERFEGGHLVIGVADIPYKCPPAPLEFAFKVEEYLQKRNLRNKTTITYLSPINRVFTIESVSTFVTPMLEERGIEYETFFNTESIDPKTKTIFSLEGSEIKYDLLVMIPPHRGAELISRSGLGDAQGWLETDRHTLEAKKFPDIYGIGDATDIPVSKSGSAAHFEAKVLAERLVDKIRGSDDEPSTYDGRVLCFLETGHGQASQLVFDFSNPPVPPAPNHFYHYEKLLFNKVYWYIVPRGIV
jgi:sulfide:quinone oxidoreductase